MNRGTRFYRRNEAKVMQRLGLRPTKNSGAGWIAKEDGESEDILCQLKSTDHQSISIKQVDLRQLENHAAVSHKVPVFAIQFLNTGEVWILAKPEHINIKTKNQNFFEFGVDKEQEKEYNTIKKEGNLPSTKNRTVGAKARAEFYKQRQEEMEQRNKEARAKQSERRKSTRRRSFNKEE